jgi:hypothetical protein
VREMRETQEERVSQGRARQDDVQRVSPGDPAKRQPERARAQAAALASKQRIPLAGLKHHNGLHAKTLARNAWDVLRGKKKPQGNPLGL